MHNDTYFEAETLDDLLRLIFPKLLDSQDTIKASRGNFNEIFGAMLVLNNPRARLSRTESKGKLFSALGELFWYLSKENNLAFIEYYLSNYKKESDDGISVRSGYGQRLFGHNENNQVNNIIALLKSKPTSRRAVIQLFDASDLSSDYKSIPCTCTLQFIIRDNKLNMLVNMRSNDAYIGLPHDVFVFTMLQEIIARSVGVDTGTYKHCAGSLHLYENDFDKARTYIDEGWQSPISMDAMPDGDPWEAIESVQLIEAKARMSEDVDLACIKLEPYWADICRLLVVFNRSKLSINHEKESLTVCNKIRSQISSSVYYMFVDARIESLKLSGTENESS